MFVTVKIQDFIKYNMVKIKDIDVCSGVCFKSQKYNVQYEREIK